MAALSSITANATASVNFTGEVSADLASPSHSFAASHVASITTIGTGTDAANQYWSDQRTLTASGTETFDLTSGLTNALGQACVFTSIKMIYIRNRNTAGEMTIGGAAANPWAAMLGTTHTLQIRRSGAFVNFCTDATGWAISGTSKNLKITNSDSSNSLIYDILLVGAQ